MEWVHCRHRTAGHEFILQGEPNLGELPFCAANVLVRNIRAGKI